MTTNTKIKTPMGRIAFHKNLFTPDEHGKYKAALVIPKEAEGSSEFKAVTDLIDFVAKEKRGDKIPKNLQTPFKFANPDDYGVDENGTPEYEFLHNNYVLNAKANAVIQGNENQVDVYEKQGNNLLRINDATKLKAGDDAQFVISAFAWEFKKKNGVSINLEAVCKMGDNEAYYQTVTNDAYFGGTVVEDTATAEEDYSF
jgi:hypothetical protein